MDFDVIQGIMLLCAYVKITIVKLGILVSPFYSTKHHIMFPMGTYSD